jgi:hypothetical protein
VGPAQPPSWTNLPKCMNFIAKNGCTLNSSLIWARRTLDRLSPTATTEQLNHILNGYADLYKLVLCFIHVTADVPVKKDDIQSFTGTSSNIEQRKRHRNQAFIMYNGETSLFAPLYVTHSDGRPQTCFAPDDEGISDHIAHLFRKLNDESNVTYDELRNVFFLSIQHFKIRLQKQIIFVPMTMMLRKTLKNCKQQMALMSYCLQVRVSIIISNDIDSKRCVDVLAIQKETALTTPKIMENDIQHSSQTIIQSDLHPNHGSIFAGLNGKLFFL